MGVLTKDDFQELEKRFATKDDLKRFATKDDLADVRNDLKRFATKDDLKGIRNDLKGFATKDELVHAVDVLEQKIERSSISLEIKLSRKIDQAVIDITQAVSRALENPPKIG